MHECTPANETKTARKRRLDHNRQVTRHASISGGGAQRPKLTALEWERRIVEAIDKEQPEHSFDMEELDGMILMAQRSQLQDRREAARTTIHRARSLDFCVF